MFEMSNARHNISRCSYWATKSNYFYCLSRTRWKRNVHKNAFAKGEATIDCKGRFKPGRETGPDCGCSFECFTHINAEQRRWILAQFNILGTSSRQNIYLRGLIVAEEPKRRVGKERQRSFSYRYYAQTADKIRKQVYSEIGHFLVVTIIGSCKMKRSIVKCYRFTRLLALLMAML